MHPSTILDPQQVTSVTNTIYSGTKVWFRLSDRPKHMFLHSGRKLEYLAKIHTDSPLIWLGFEVSQYLSLDSMLRLNVSPLCSPIEKTNLNLKVVKCYLYHVLSNTSIIVHFSISSSNFPTFPRIQVSKVVLVHVATRACVPDFLGCSCADSQTCTWSVSADALQSGVRHCCLHLIWRRDGNHESHLLIWVTLFTLVQTAIASFFPPLRWAVISKTIQESVNRFLFICNPSFRLCSVDP